MHIPRVLSALLLASTATARPFLAGKANANLTAKIIRNSPVPNIAIEKRSFELLADGAWMQSGQISDTFRWQASGVLSRGSCESLGITDCFLIHENSHGHLEGTENPTSSPLGEAALLSRVGVNAALDFEERAAANDSDLEAYYAFKEGSPADLALDVLGDGRTSLMRQRVASNCTSGGGGGGGGQPKPPSPRQRVELLSWPGASAGQTWTYTWKSHMVDTSSTKHFFHTWQLLGRDACGKGGPIITLDVYDGLVAINDQVRKCATCVSAPLGLFFDRTIVHRMTVTYGANGSVEYSATPFDSPESTLLSYISRGRDTGDEGSVKFGSYRLMADGLQPVTDYVGDYFAVQH